MRLNDVTSSSALKNNKVVKSVVKLLAGSKACEMETVEASENIPSSEKSIRSPCLPEKPAENDDTKKSDSEDSFDSGSEADDSADEDFSLKGPKKKRKKVKKKRVEKERRTRAPKNVRRVPTFDEVMNAQMQHSYRYIDYDIFASEASSIDEAEVIDERPDAEEILDERPEADRSRTPTPEPPPREKKKRIIIYPWNPIGITGGRPVADVSKLS